MHHQPEDDERSCEDQLSTALGEIKRLKAIIDRYKKILDLMETVEIVAAALVVDGETTEEKTQLEIHKEIDEFLEKGPDG